MNKTFLLHDLDKEDAKVVFENISNNTLVFSATPTVKHCIGCFNCWTKTPGKCVISDRCNITPALLASSSNFIIVSKLIYGGFSSSIKAVLDRSIGYLMPHFRIIENEMHHVMRYENPFNLIVHFYNDNISDIECNIARELVKANSLNLGAASYDIKFYNSINEIKI